jgi:hypothetical protein
LKFLGEKEFCKLGKPLDDADCSFIKSAPIGFCPQGGTDAIIAVAKSSFEFVSVVQQVHKS